MATITPRARSPPGAGAPRRPARRRGGSRRRAYGGARGRGLRAQGPAPAHACRDGESPARTEREIADARQYAVASFARDMLTVADNLRRAIAAVPPEARANDPALSTLIDGVEVTERGLEQTLTKFGVRPIEAERPEVRSRLSSGDVRGRQQRHARRHRRRGHPGRLRHRRPRASPRFGGDLAKAPRPRPEATAPPKSEPAGTPPG